MNLSSSSLKAQARSVLSQNYWLSVLVCLIASLLTGVGAGTGIFTFSRNIATNFDYGGIIENASVSFNPLGGAGSLVSFIIGGAISIGLAAYFLNMLNNANPQLTDLFAHFKYFGNTFVMQLLTAIFVFLWSLLLIIPGIIAGYSYALAPYILAEHPEIRASEALKMSKKMMDGHKGELFILDLSFIGWYLLCILTLGLGFFFLSPYVHAARAAFFNEVSGNNYERAKNPPAFGGNNSNGGFNQNNGYNPNGGFNQNNGYNPNGGFNQGNNYNPNGGFNPDGFSGNNNGNVFNTPSQGSSDYRNPVE